MRKKEKKKMKKAIVLAIAIAILLLLSGTAQAVTLDPITHTSLVSIPEYADPGDTFWINHTFTSTKEIDITLYLNITPYADGWNTTALLNDEEIHSGDGNFTCDALVAREGLNRLAFRHTSQPEIVATAYRFDASLRYEPIVVPDDTPPRYYRGGGSGGGVAAPKMNVPVDPTTGAVTSTTTLTAAGATLTIQEGTKVEDAEGNILSTPIFALHAPTTAESVGAIAAYEFGPSGMTFEPAIDLVIPYDPADLPEGFSESDLVIRMWDSTTSAWIDLDTTVDTTAHTATAKVSHFSIFALFVAAPVAPPVTPTPVVTPSPTVTPTSMPTPTPIKEFPLIPIVAIVVAAILVSLAYAMRRKK